MLPWESSTAKSTSKGAPTVTLVGGGPINAICVSLPGTTSSEFDAADATLSLETDNELPVPAWLIVTAENVATPWTAATTNWPVKGPAPFSLASITLPSKEGSTLPDPSTACTTRPKAAPAATLPGGCVVTKSRSLVTSKGDPASVRTELPARMT